MLSSKPKVLVPGVDVIRLQYTELCKGVTGMHMYWLSLEDDKRFSLKFTLLYVNPNTVHS